MLSVRDTKSVTELFHSFAVFYYINGRLPYTDRHLFVPDREILQEIQGEKLSLKELFAKIFRTKSNGLAYAPFLAALLLFSAGKQSLVRTSSQNYIETEYLNTLILELSTYWVLGFQTLTDLCAEINVRLANSIFANHKRARLDMKKQEEQISKKKYGFFNDDGDNKDFPDDASIEKESDFPDDNNDDVLIKQGSDNEIEEIDDRETIP